MQWIEFLYDRARNPIVIRARPGPERENRLRWHGKARRLARRRVEAHAALGTKVGVAGIQNRARTPEAVRAPSAIKVQPAAGQDHESQNGNRSEEHTSE